uniref:Protein KTI12 homolog n=1 Tax=Strigamia maritima TaxID=126957 RepID=T1J0D8_STRMM
MRANLKSEVNRLLGNGTIVILDSLNYIKGYRYELFCLAKLMKTTNLVIHLDVNKETAWQWNATKGDSDVYTREVFDALIQRFEAPDSRNRWDKPLITVQSDGEISMDEVSDAVFAVQRLKPNKSTQSIPLNSSNYLYDLDRKTQDVVNV